ncbi:MAG: tetratricopeptide repeat protein, partial [Clostridiales bacterium]|nr:tetratricopeptide repeat protein [Clostridiales bacterium]
MNKITYFRKQIYESSTSGNWAEAAESGEALLAEYRYSEPLGGFGISYADDLFNLARAYDELGMTDKASSLYMDSANRVFFMLGISREFACRLNNLAVLMSKTGRLVLARHLYGQVLTVLNFISDTENREIADALYNAANAAADMNQYDEAVKLHKEALEIRLSNSVNQDIVNSLHSLAFIHEGKKDYAQAIKYASDAMSFAKKMEDTGDTFFRACYYLACLYDNENMHQHARPLYEMTLKWIEKKESRGHSAYVTVGMKLAYVLTSLDACDDALLLMNDIREMLEKTLHGDFLCYAGCLKNLAHLHRQLGVSEQSIPLLLKSIHIRKRVMGVYANDNILPDIMTLLAQYMDGGQVCEAADMLVYLLMCSNTAQLSKAVPELSRIFVKSGHEKFNTLLSELEKLSD